MQNITLISQGDPRLLTTVALRWPNSPGLMVLLLVEVIVLCFFYLIYLLLIFLMVRRIKRLQYGNFDVVPLTILNMIKYHLYIVFHMLVNVCGRGYAYQLFTLPIRKNMKPALSIIIGL